MMVKPHNFILVNVDTDSISFCKKDQSPFTPEERQQLLIELNNYYPEKINFTDDGYYPNVVVLKAKNYAMRDETGKVKIKGSALRTLNRELALKEFINECVLALLDNNIDAIRKIYFKYIKEAMNITNIRRWVKKVTITEKIYTSKRSNETKILEAIKNYDYQIGDKVALFFKPDKSLCVVDEFNGIYDKNIMLNKLYSTLKIFNQVIDINNYKNYKLQKNKKELEDILNGKYD